MENKEFEFRVIELNSKFDYAFTSIAFAAIALSFQYSPKIGTKWPYLLIASWILLLLSGLAGGWRLMKEPSFYKHDLQAGGLQKRIHDRQSRLTDPLYVSALKAGTAVDGITGNPLNENEQREILKYLEEEFELHKSKMQKISSDLPKYFKLQFFSFVSGITLNGIFNAINYLSKI